ncbi:MAG TPA: tetratricopeptide repeat protein [Acidobacteriota bacterium]|nr:tetratricopeptide repeat protein [Acidobacteriota bacterium]
MAKRKGKVRQEPVWYESTAFLWLACLCLILFAVALFSNTLDGEFVFDDRPLILQNPQVTHQLYGDILFPTRGYRPIRTLTYALNYALGGDNPFGYHLFNIVLHGLNGVLLFLLLRLWTGGNLASLAASALFLAHPAQTAAVAYVSGRKDLLALSFILAGLLLYSRFRRTGRHWSLAGAVILFVLGFFSKEVVVVVPALLLLADALHLEGRTAEADDDSQDPSIWRVWVKAAVRHPLLYAGAALAALAGLYYAIFIMRASRMVGLWGGSWETNLGTSFKLFAHYAKMILWPFPLIADYKGNVFPISSGMLEPATLLALVAAIAYAALAVWVYRRAPLVSLGLFWFALFLLPVLHFIPFHEVAADHFLYVPLAGTALAAADLLRRLFKRAQVPSAAVWAVLAVILAAASWSAVQRNRLWTDDTLLWEDTLAKAPDSFRANVNLGRIYFEEYANNRDKRRQGLEMTRRATHLEPMEATAHVNLGSMYFEIGSKLKDQPQESKRLVELGLDIIKRGLELDPSNPSALSNIGNCYKTLSLLERQAGNSAEAEMLWQTAKDYYERALRSDSRRETRAAHYNLAVLYQDVGKNQAAQEQLGQFLAAWPNHADGNARMGTLLMTLGRPEEAEPYLRKAVGLKPIEENFLHLARAQHTSGQSQKAINTYKLALRYHPDRVEIYFNMAQIYYTMGRIEDSRRAFRTYLERGRDPRLLESARGALQQLEEEKDPSNVPR